MSKNKNNTIVFKSCKRTPTKLYVQHTTQMIVNNATITNLIL